MIIENLMKRLPSRLGVLGINRRNRDYIYPNNPRPAFPNVDDKLRCKELLAAAGIPVPETMHVIDGHASLQTWPQAINDRPSFVIKPNQSYGGRGILLVRCEDGSFRVDDASVTSDDLTAHIRRIMNGVFSSDNIEDKAYLEETVVNAPGLRPFVSEETSGVADVRLICLKETVIMAMLRVPTRASGGKANLHQGGLGIGIDLDTGLSLGGFHEGKIVDCHPETGRSLAGREVPGFRYMLEIGSRVSNLVGLGFTGVDLVCDADKGVQVLEVNARPGLSIQMANMAGLGRRLG